MNFNGYAYLIVGLLVLDYVLNLVIDWLNMRHVQTEIPDEFNGWFDEQKYAASQRYLRDTTRFGLLSSTIMTPVIIVFILLGGFGFVDHLARSMGQGMILTGLAFGGMLVVISTLADLPFSIYSTFVIEERYGFNKTTARTFIADRLKSLFLTAAIGAPLFAGILWFFSRTGEWAWLYSWATVCAVQLFVIYLAPVLILPLFNKFIPLEDGALRSSIEAYAKKQDFSLKGVFKIDGSRRSTKSNAYFTGFGKWRRIALFDTLIEKHSVGELVAVLAHEIGHYKLGHIRKGMIVSMLSAGLMFFILAQFIDRPGLYAAFNVPFDSIGEYAPIYAGMVFFGFLYSPISHLIGIIGNILSRKHEFEADAFAVTTDRQPEVMVSALKKLAVDNLSNLTPHPAKVFLEYSHPPVLKRIEAIRNIRL
ncbi:MAG: M48 family metallopeptidase [Verrucomicrobia bacterium]|nr:M48 family metallopeptidase [Verrucomicrobiota bacterium]